jgi:hypothetical protein
MTDLNDLKKQAIIKVLESFTHKENLVNQRMTFPQSIPQ